MDLEALALFDPFARQFIAGEAAIAAAAGYKDARHFAETAMRDVRSRSVIDGCILSQHTLHGHFYDYLGHVVTHPNSAEAWGQRRRDAISAERTATTSGWRGARACPLSGGSAAVGT